MPSKRKPAPPIAVGLLRRSWQPALSIAAIIFSLISLVEADRANDLAEKQFETEQARQRLLDERTKRESRSVVLADISTDAREVLFSIPVGDVRLRQVMIWFPPQLKAKPVWTAAGRPQTLQIDEFEKPLQKLVLPDFHGRLVSDDVLVFFPVLLSADLSGRGEAYAEMSTYTVQVRSNLVGGKPRITIESFEMDEPLPGGVSREQQDRLLAKCWKTYEPGMGRHDLSRTPMDGVNRCPVK